MRHDLHIHTTASDGALSPTAIVEAAVDGGLDVIAITDHDTTAGVAEARAAAEGSDLTVLSGIEVSSTWAGREVHVLGYGVDPGADAVRGLDARARERRLERMAEMVGRLDALGIHVTMEDVLRAAGPDHHMIGRPHLARALVEAGHASSIANAFDRWIADHHPAFVPTDLGDPRLAIETVCAAGGIPVWAHPPHDLLDPLLAGMVDAGLRGLEAFRPNHSARMEKRLRDAASEHGLVVTGGSDWHNLERNDPLGAFWVTSGKIRAFRSELGLSPDA